jgi:hypothetical protein
VPSVVEELGEISLNSVLYRTKGPVRPVLTSQYPPKVVIGDTSKNSQLRTSIVSWSDWRGGIGIERMDIQTDVHRAWHSTFQLRHKNHLVLPALATVTAASGVTGTFTIGAMAELASEIYVAFGTAVRKYNNTTDSWGSTLHTLPAVATDAITVRLGGTVYLIFAHTGGYSYSTDGSTWVDDTKDVLYVTWWDDQLWAIDNTGQLRSSRSIGTWANNARLPLQDGYVTDLFTAREATGKTTVYAATTEGLWARDPNSAQWVYTDLQLPFHPDGGNGSTLWRGDIFYPAGLSIYRYIVGSDRAIITVMGPDRDDGLISDQRGTIRQLIGTHNELLAILDATSAPGSVNMYASTLATHRGAVMNPDAGFSSILGWDAFGWEFKWTGGSSDRAIDYAIVSNAYSTYRLWWAHNERVSHMSLPREIINPSEVTTFAYAASADHQTPWFDAGQSEVDKLALNLFVECDQMTVNETLTISYALNYSSSYTQLGVISTDGITIYRFPDSVTPTGTAFRAIRFRVQGVRGSTTTRTPDMINLTLEFRKKLPSRWGWAVELDISQEYKGNTPDQQRTAIITAAESATLVQFTHRDAQNADSIVPTYVDVQNVEGLEQTGQDFRGRVRLMLVEP